MGVRGYGLSISRDQRVMGRLEGNAIDYRYTNSNVKKMQKRKSTFDGYGLTYRTLTEFA